jgi:hypothetical protein
MALHNFKMNDQEIFQYLITIAGEDSEIHQRLVSILSLNKDERSPLLDLLLHHSKLQKAPQEFKNIFAYFLDDQFTQEVLHYLKVHTP